MYNPEMIDILLRQQGRKAKDLAKHLSGNERQPLTSITKQGANPTAETLEKIADFFLVSVDTLFMRNVELPNVDAQWTIDKRSEYYEKAMVAKDHLINALYFERESQQSCIAAQRETILNIEDEIAELKVLLREHKITALRHIMTKHPILTEEFMWDGTLPEEYRQKIMERARERMKAEGIIK